MFTPFGKREIFLSALLSIGIFVVLLFLSRRDSLAFLKYFLVVPVIGFLFTLFFFRDPKRKILYKRCEILAPCDGFVTHIDTVFEPYYFKKKARRISIFMTMFDVHVQRSPVNGRVVYIEYHKGSFLNAQKEESLEKNENNIIVIESEYGFPVVVKQIAGVFARRIVCAVRVGDTLSAGEKIGMVKFGSRGEVYIPEEVELEIYVKKGQHVKAGITALGRLKLCQ